MERSRFHRLAIGRARGRRGDAEVVGSRTTSHLAGRALRCVRASPCALRALASHVGAHHRRARLQGGWLACSAERHLDTDMVAASPRCRALPWTQWQRCFQSPCIARSIGRVPAIEPRRLSDHHAGLVGQGLEHPLIHGRAALSSESGSRIFSSTRLCDSKEAFMNKSAWLITSLIGVAALTACGKQESTSTTTTTPPAAVTPAPAPEPATPPAMAPAPTPAPDTPAAAPTPAPNSQAALDDANKAVEAARKAAADAAANAPKKE